jgi:hypothetical protein
LRGRPVDESIDFKSRSTIRQKPTNFLEIVVSDIQRYVALPRLRQHDEGSLVTYADHVEALRQARDEAVAEHMALVGKVRLGQYAAGQRDALAAAVQRVEALIPEPRHGSQVLSVIEVIAAIKGAAPHDDPCDCDDCKSAVQYDGQWYRDLYGGDSE